MDEFGSPISGGIRAVRRNISSSFFGARPQTDSISNDLIQEQSLKLSTVSSQLSNISRQLTSLDFNLKAVRENLALSDQLERQREAEKQKRERILAEQGLREGKESALEQKIQSSLTQPLQKIGARTQSILGGLTKFLFTLAGGWLTITGIDLLQSMAEGNVDKINRLKTKFLTGLTILLGSLGAIQLGIKKTLGILGFFAGNVARVAFGGVLRAAFASLRLLFGGLVRRAGTIGGLGGIGRTIRTIINFAIGEIIGQLTLRGFGRVFKNIPGLKSLTNKVPKTKVKITGDVTKTKVKNPFNLKNINKKVQNARQTVSTKIKTGLENIDETVRGKKVYSTTPRGKNFVGIDPTMNPNAIPRTKMFRSGGLLNRAGNIFNKGKKFIDDGIKTITSPKLLAKLGIKTGGKGVLKSLAKKLPLIGAVAGLVFGIERALGGDGLGAALEIISGILGATGVGGGASLGIDAFLIGRDIKKANTKTDDNESEQIYRIPEGGEGDLIPIKKDQERIDKISGFTEDRPQVIDLSQNNMDNSGAAGGGTVTEEESNTIPDISFNNNNSHVLAATVNYGF